MYDDRRRRRQHHHARFGDGTAFTLMPYSPIVDLFFTRNLGYVNGVYGTAEQFITTTRASEEYVVNAAGVYVAKADNVAALSDLGLNTWMTRTNLFLNSGVPVTQSVTVVNASVYTVSVVGTGSIALSGAGTGTVSQGSPVTFTAGSTSLTLTTSGITGTFVNVNVELGLVASPPIRTTGASATRAVDLVTRARTNPTTIGMYLEATAGVNPGPTLTEVLWNIDNGSNSERIFLYRYDGNLAIAVITGGVFFGIGSVPIANNTSFKAALRVGANDIALAVNGVRYVTDTSKGMPSGMTTERLGTAFGGTTTWNGTNKRQTEYVTLSDAQLLALTA